MNRRTDDSSALRAADALQRVARHFADDEQSYFRNVVVLPSADARVNLLLRRDAGSSNRLALELAIDACVECPDNGVTFDDSFTCVVRDDQSGEDGANVIEPTRCLHFIDDSNLSAGTLFRELQPFAQFASDDATRTVYGVLKKFQDRGEEHTFAIGKSPFALREALETASADDIERLAATVENHRASTTWLTWFVAAVGALLLALFISLIAVFLIRRARNGKVDEQSDIAGPVIYDERQPM